MVDQAYIQSKINYGYGKAASKLGQSYVFYRPSTSGNPIVSGNIVATLLVDLTADFGSTGARPNLYGKPVWSAMFDRTVTRGGDYFVGPEGTFFIAAQQSLAPTAAVECNAVVTISRPSSPAPSINAYEGAVDSDLTPLLTSGPASVLQGTKGNDGDTKLPGDIRLPWKAILLPPTPGVQIRNFDVIFDAAPIPNRYIVSGVELTDLGWRMTAAEEAT